MNTKNGSEKNPSTCLDSCRKESTKLSKRIGTRMTHNCRVCGVKLCDDNWSPSYPENNQYICKECDKKRNRVLRESNSEKVKERDRLYYEANRDEINERRCLYREKNPEKERERNRLYRKNNPEKIKASNTKRRRKNGQLPMSENRECPSWLGVHVNEGLLKMMFNDVVVMPYGTAGYDFVCNNGKKIDGKSSATGDKGHLSFHINHNTTADYFFCAAYDNRKDLNIIHIWMLPGDKFNHLVCATISLSTVHKWAEYEHPLGKAILCCDSMKNGDIQ